MKNAIPTGQLGRVWARTAALSCACCLAILPIFYDTTELNRVELQAKVQRRR